MDVPFSKVQVTNNIKERAKRKYKLKYKTVNREIDWLVASSGIQSCKNVGDAFQNNKKNNARQRKHNIQKKKKIQKELKIQK